MEQIIIPSYNVVIANKIFERESTNFVNPESNFTEPAMELVRLQKARIPKKGEILDYIIDNLSEFNLDNTEIHLIDIINENSY